jgi:hypothetical protein
MERKEKKHHELASAQLDEDNTDTQTVRRIHGLYHLAAEEGVPMRRSQILAVVNPDEQPDTTLRRLELDKPMIQFGGSPRISDTSQRSARLIRQIRRRAVLVFHVSPAQRCRTKSHNGQALCQQSSG